MHRGNLKPFSISLHDSGFDGNCKKNILLQANTQTQSNEESQSGESNQRQVVSDGNATEGKRSFNFFFITSHSLVVEVGGEKHANLFYLQMNKMKLL